MLSGERLVVRAPAGHHDVKFVSRYALPLGLLPSTRQCHPTSRLRGSQKHSCPDRGSSVAYSPKEQVGALGPSSSFLRDFSAASSKWDASTVPLSFPGS